MKSEDQTAETNSVENRLEENKLTKTTNQSEVVNQTQEEDPLEKLFDVENFFKGTIYASSLLLVTLIGFFFMFPDMQLHFGIMIILCASLLGVVLL